MLVTSLVSGSKRAGWTVVSAGEQSSLRLQNQTGIDVQNLGSKLVSGTVKQSVSAI